MFRIAVAASHEDPRMASLAGSLACTLCHREAPAPREAGDAPPLAPTFREIASRYRHDPKAEERLTHEVIEGIDPADRHWKDRADFTRMGANAPRVTPDEARAPCVRRVFTRVVTWLQGRGYAGVEELAVATEHVHFPLPAGLD